MVASIHPFHIRSCSANDQVVGCARCTVDPANGSDLVTEIIDKFAGEYDLQDHLSLPITAGTLRQFLHGPEIVGGQVDLSDVEIIHEFMAHPGLNNRRKRWPLYLILAAHVLFSIVIFCVGYTYPSTGGLAKIEFLLCLLQYFEILRLLVTLWRATGLLVRSCKSPEDREKSTLDKMLSTQKDYVQGLFLRFPKWALVVRIGITLLACSGMLAFFSAPIVTHLALQTRRVVSTALVQGHILRFIRSRAKRQKLAQLPTGIWMHDMFALWNLETAIIYCAYAYNPAGTSQPAWTNFLG